MNRKNAGRLRTAALVLTTAMSISVSSLAIWKIGPEISCNHASQNSNTFARMSVGGSLKREVERNRGELLRSIPFTGKSVLTITVSIRGNGEARIVGAKVREAKSFGGELDLTSRVKELIKIRKMSRFSDSDFTRTEDFEFSLHKG